MEYTQIVVQIRHVQRRIGEQFRAELQRLIQDFSDSRISDF
jgi:hypothetical protein